MWTCASERCGRTVYGPCKMTGHDVEPLRCGVNYGVFYPGFQIKECRACVEYWASDGIFRRVIVCGLWKEGRMASLAKPVETLNLKVGGSTLCGVVDSFCSPLVPLLYPGFPWLVGSCMPWAGWCYCPDFRFVNPRDGHHYRYTHRLEGG